MLPSHHTKHILLDPLKSPEAHYMKIFTFKVEDELACYRAYLKQKIFNLVTLNRKKTDRDQAL